MSQQQYSSWEYSGRIFLELCHINIPLGNIQAEYKYKPQTSKFTDWSFQSKEKENEYIDYITPWQLPYQLPLTVGIFIYYFLFLPFRETSFTKRKFNNDTERKTVNPLSFFITMIANQYSLRVNMNIASLGGKNLICKFRGQMQNLVCSKKKLQETHKNTDWLNIYHTMKFKKMTKIAHNMCNFLSFFYEVLVLGTHFLHEDLHLTSELTSEVFPAQRRYVEDAAAINAHFYFCSSFLHININFPTWNNVDILWKIINMGKYSVIYIILESYNAVEWQILQKIFLLESNAIMINVPICQFDQSCL